MGPVAVANALKFGARQAVDSLRRLGSDVVMLTGDNPSAAAAIAQQAGIDRFEAELKPAQKASRVKALQNDGKTVAMVEDGINVAPALAQAHVGIAIDTGTDVAEEAADMTLVGSELQSVATGVSLSRTTMTAIRQNLFWAFAYNVLLVPVAAGVMYPVFSVPEVPDSAASSLWRVRLPQLCAVGSSHGHWFGDGGGQFVEVVEVRRRSEVQ